MFNALERYGIQENNSAWIFATVALKLHLDHSKLTVPTKEFASFRECMNAYVDVLAAAQASGRPLSAS
jgi:hypothetical protein